MATWTTAGLNLLASAVQSASAAPTITYVGISPGCGTLGSPIAGGVAITSLALAGTLPANLASGQSLTITDGVHSETCTTNGTQTAGAGSIAINSFTPANSYAAGTTVIVPTPAAGDSTLYNETVRVAANAGVAGAAAGESLNSGYFDGTQATAVFGLVGYFGGSSATSAPGTGTLMVEDVQYWNHTLNGDSIMYQADTTI